MKTIFLILAVSFSFVSFANYAQAQIHTGSHNHFYLHGFTGDSTNVKNLALWEDDNLTRNFKSFPQIRNYSSYFGFTFNSVGVCDALTTAHSEGEYVGVGYSAGGLLTRQITLDKATWDNINSRWENLFVDGFVTVDAPNNGARIAAHWQEWLFNSALAGCKIARGEASFLAYLAYIPAMVFSTALSVLGSAIQAFWPMTIDLKPSSTFISNINSGTPLAKQYGTSLGSVAVFAQIDASTNGHRYRFPAYSASGSNYNTAINSAMDDYQSKINDARSNAGYHDWKVNHLKGFWNVLARGWHRMRRNDWNACGDGYGDLNDTWEWATANRDPSDAFIAVSSQVFSSQHTPIRIVNNMNHGGAVVAGSPGSTATPGATAVRTALHDSLGLTN